MCVCVCAIFVYSTTSVAQMSCGSDNTSSPQPNPLANRALISQTSLQTTYCIKVYVHVIRDRYGNGGQPDFKVFRAVDDLNLFYNPYNIYFDWNEQIIDLPDQGYFTTAHETVLTDNDHTDGVDIYLFPDINDFWGGMASGVGQGTAILISGRYKGDQMPVIETPFIVHEMGHILGLYHTFHGTYQNNDENENDPDACPELPDNSNGNGNDCGDYINDTPADPYMNFNVDPTTCEWTQPYGAYMPSTSNYMAYTHPNCMNNFTTEQVRTMKYELANLTHLQDVINQDCCAITDLDLFIKDSPEDYGVEPNTTTENMWVSEDIWIRNSDDDGLTHQNPVYKPAGTPNYINVRVINRSCYSATNGSETLTINWAKAGTALDYPDYWNGTVLDGDGDALGGELPPVAIPSIAENDETIVKIPWVVPNPDDYEGDDRWHFCLLATILGNQDGLTMDVTHNPNIMVRANNNQAWKNITVVPLGDGITSGTVMVSNPNNFQRAFTLEFEVKSSESGKAIYTEAEVSVEMDDTLYAIWQRGGNQQTDLIETKNDQVRQIQNNGASLKNLIFNPNERALLTLNFNMLVKELTAKNKYTIHVIQKDKITNEVIGGETFVVYKEIRETFAATAGSDREIDADQSVTISPQQITEAGTYNWYDPEGNLVYQGTSLTVTAAMAKKYTLEVIADADGFKDYDEVEVTLKPSRIVTVSPNPVTSNALQINYKLNAVTSAYLMIVDQNSGVSQNYILNTTTSSTTLNLNTYNAGIYTIALVCDTEIVDARTFIKQ